TGIGYSVMLPVTVMRPILFPLFDPSANHSAPSGPTVMPYGWLLAVASGYSRSCPLVSMRPMAFPPFSVNHSAPSGPAAIPNGREVVEGSGYSCVVVPDAGLVV